MGVFIRIDVERERLNPALSRQIAEVCPVDIYAVEAGQLIVRPDEEDECTLCELCLRIAPPDSIHIHKLYSGEILIAMGTVHNERR